MNAKAIRRICNVCAIAVTAPFFALALEGECKDSPDPVPRVGAIEISDATDRVRIGGDIVSKIANIPQSRRVRVSVDSAGNKPAPRQEIFDRGNIPIQVVYTDGTPVVDAEVYIRCDDTGVMCKYTNKNGYIQIRDIVARTTTLFVMDPERKYAAAQRPKNGNNRILEIPVLFERGTFEWESRVAGIHTFEYNSLAPLPETVVAN